MINATVIGRMTKEPNLRTVNINGVQTPVLNFTLACDDGFKKDDNGKKVDTEFIRVTAWRGAAEAIAKYCGKGRSLGVKGAIHLGKYLDKQTNEVRYNLEIPRPEGFEFLGSAPVEHVDNTPEDVEDLPWAD